MKIKDLLTSDDKWTQGVMARDRFGRECLPGSPDAESYCIMGALCKAYDDGGAMDRAIIAILNAIGLDEEWYECPTGAIENWNDDADRTFEDVRKVLEKADV
jgi:hypothetical protein